MQRRLGPPFRTAGAAENIVRQRLDVEPVNSNEVIDKVEEGNILGHTMLDARQVCTAAGRSIGMQLFVEPGRLEMTLDVRLDFLDAESRHALDRRQCGLLQADWTVPVAGDGAVGACFGRSVELVDLKTGMARLCVTSKRFDRFRSATPLSPNCSGTSLHLLSFPGDATRRPLSLVRDPPTSSA